ncbi:MAG TPA: MFS transporter [Sediminispirochaeta sp.]|nr:MFS transporter [Sediminispirochaeta sp.]
MFKKDLQYYKFSLYGFVKNLQFFDPYLILYFREVGLSYLQIGVLFSVREIGTNLLEIPSGVIADTFGRRRAMMSAFAAYIVSFLVFYFFPLFGAYIGAMVLFSVGEAFRTGTHKAMILDYLKRNGMEQYKVHYYGHTRGWSQRGSALSALIAGLIVFISGSYRHVFLFTVIPYILGFGLMKSYPKYLDFSLERETDQASRGGDIGEKIKRDFRASLGGTIGDFKEMLRYGRLRRLLLNSSLHDGVFKSVKDYVQPVMKSMALSLPIFVALAEQERVALMVGILYFFIYTFTSLVSQNSGRVAEMFRSTEWGLNFTYLASVMVVFGVGASLLANLAPLGALFFVLLYVLHNLRRPMTLGYVSEKIKGTVMATGLSVESQLKTLIVAILSPLFGYLADVLGLGLALGLLALLPLLFYPLLAIRREDEGEEK